MSCKGSSSFDMPRPLGQCEWDLLCRSWRLCVCCNGAASDLGLFSAESLRSYANRRVSEPGSDAGGLGILVPTPKVMVGNVLASNDGVHGVSGVLGGVTDSSDPHCDSMFLHTTYPVCFVFVGKDVT